MSFYVGRKSIRRVPGIVVKPIPLPQPHITEGFCSRTQVGVLCQQHGFSSVLLVTDKTLAELGFHHAIEQSLVEAGIPCALFCNINSEPTVGIVSEGRDAARACQADCIIALGGGSVLDSCKIIAASAKHPQRSIDFFLRKFVFAKTIPLIMIPSTAGTGAETTIGAVIRNRRGVKHASVLAGLQIPEVILDSELTINAPERVTMACGIDALSHGLEGCLADVRVASEDLRKSQTCVRLVLENLPALKDDPHNVERRQALCLAAHYGGNAINKQLAGYIHAFAHTLGGIYHVSHGEVIARCMLPVLAFHKDLCRAQLADLGRFCEVANADDSDEMAVLKFYEKVRQTLKQCGFSGGFDAISWKDFPKLIHGINLDSVNYSPPKTLTNREIVGLLRQIKQGI